MSAKQYGIPMPIQFDRLYAGPLEKYDTFESYAEALVYAQGPISYPGQRIGVKKSGLKEDVYVINQDKSLSRLMIQREDIRVVLKKDAWTGGCPYEQTVAIPYLEATDNCIISLGESVTDPEIVREIVNAKIGDTIQEEGAIRFIARGSVPTVDIPITVTIGSVVSAVEIPNNVNDNTNHTVVIAKKDAWEGVKPPYTQQLYVFGVRPDSNGTIGINPDSSYAQINKMAAATAGVVRYEQGNNYVTIAAMNSKPTRDLEILVVWGDEIVVFENSDTLEDFNTSVDLVLKANEWTENIPYTQTLRVEGLSEYHTGAIGLSDNCTPEEAEIAMNAELELIEQGEGYVVVRSNNIKPVIDIPIYLTYGSNITIVPSPEYVGEANRHVDTTAYASKWTKTVDGWEQEVDVNGITSNSIGTMGLRNGCTDLQAYNAAVSRIKIKKVYDNKVVLNATKMCPTVNIPLCFVFGRNINVAKYPGVVGKVTVDTSYIAFDDSLINSGLSSLQQLLELYNTRINKNSTNISNNSTLIEQLTQEDIAINDRIDELDARHEEDNREIRNNITQLIADNDADHADIINMIEELEVENKTEHEEINESITSINNSMETISNVLSDLQKDLGNTVIKVQKDKPSGITGKNVIWIKTETNVIETTYTVTFNADGGTGAPSKQTGTTTIVIPTTIPTKTGHTFVGWTRLGYNDKFKAGELITVTENMTLYAVWTPTIYRVSLNNQLGTDGTSEIYYKYLENAFYTNKECTTKITKIEIPTKTDSTFKGYYTEINGAGNRYITASGEFENSLFNKIDISTLYADWDSSNYIITFDGNGGINVPDPQTASIGASLIITDKTPTKSGYTFAGWTTDKDSNVVEWKPGDEYDLNEDIILYAVWTPNVYCATLTDNTEVPKIYYRYKTPEYFLEEACETQIADIIVPANPDSTSGSVFTGYYNANIPYINREGVILESLCNVSNNITLTIKWGKPTYIIEYTIDEDATNKPESHEAEQDSKVKLTTVEPVLEGYVFKGWRMDAGTAEYPNGKSVGYEDIIAPGAEIIIKDDIVFEAMFNKIIKTSLIDKTSGTEVELGSFYSEYGIDEYYSDEDRSIVITTVEVPETDENYVFDGYYGEKAKLDEDGNDTGIIEEIECVNRLGEILPGAYEYTKVYLKLSEVN